MQNDFILNTLVHLYQQPLNIPNTTLSVCLLMLSTHAKMFSADDILKCFSYFSQKTGFDISCKLSLIETICMKYQILFYGKNKKNIINLSSAELAPSLGGKFHPRYLPVAFAGIYRSGKYSSSGKYWQIPAN